MNSLEHDRSMLGAYALGALDPVEAQQVHDHIAGCAECRREVADLTDLRAAMDEVPQEAFLDGPPDSGDLLLQRTLRAARVQSAVPYEPVKQPARRGFQRVLVAASVIVAAAVALGAGILVGRGTVSQPADNFAAANVQRAETTNSATGVRLAVAVAPQMGWVRIRATAQGIPTGEECQILVVPKSGEPVLTASWVVSERGTREGTTLESAALVDPANVQSVEVVNTAGRKFVEVRL